MRTLSTFSADFRHLFLVVIFMYFVVGCGNAPNQPGVGSTSVGIRGLVHGGQQPVSGATIQLYAVGTSGDGSPSTALLTQPVTSNSDGSFQITSLYSCTNATFVYLLATGGNPGIGATNPNLALMAALGPCSSLTSSTFISINEVTTVAAVSALAPFMASSFQVGSSATDQASLATAFTLASQLANISTGTSPGVNVPAGTTIPSTLINTLANIVAACVNTSGGPVTTPTVCGEFFALSTPGTLTPPSNDISALLNLANNPTLNTAALFNLITPAAPFQPTFNVAPADFRIRPLTVSTISLTPSSIVFPSGTIGVTSAPQTVQVQNIGGSSIASLTFNFSGTNATSFRLGNSCVTPLAVGDTCNVQVTYTNQTVGPHIGYLNVTADSNATQYVTLTNVNPTPVLTGLNPPTVPSGSPIPLGIFAVGSNFTPASVVKVNGTPRFSGYFSTGFLLFQLTAAEQAAPGSFVVSVTDPASGATSATSTFTVTGPATTPAITSVTPSQFTAGAASTTIQVVGTNLTPNCVVQWNGTNLATSYGYTSNAYYLVATVPANLLANSGTVAVTVNNSVVTPSASNAAAITILPPPPPTLVSLSTSLVPVNTATTLTLTGTNFTPSTTVQINGVSVPSTENSAFQLTANLSGSIFATPGLYTVTVSNAQGTTTAQTITAYVQMPNNSMIYDPVNGLFYLSVPSAAGAPYGNSIVSVDPLTGALGTPIPVGSEPNRMAITSDGRYIWVALDGASAIRKVDVLAGTSGLQFSYATQGNSTNTVSALAALPGATDSVIVSTYYGGYTVDTGTTLAIYDSGVARSSTISFATYAPFPWAMIVDSSKSEIYGPGSVDQYPANYITYQYSAAGITLKSSTPSNFLYANSSTDDVQLAGGRLYTSYGNAVDPESGAPLGTFYSNGSTVAQGSISVDATLGKAFILGGSTGAFSNGPTFDSAPVTLTAFNTADYTLASSTISLSTPTYRPPYEIQGQTGARLTRWGINGLAFRGSGGFVSLRSTLVKDLSANNADLSVALVNNGVATTSGTTTYTATITNSGPTTASGVLLSGFLPSTGVLASATASAGTCSGSGPVLCNLGNFANGASATVVFNVLQTTSGSAVMTTQVSASETDPAPTNNQASSALTISGNPFYTAPVLASISPAAIVSGSPDTIITLNGTGFTNLSSVLMNGTPLSTSFTSSTVLTAVVPTASLANLGWTPISVSTPAPGGGISSAVPLTIFSVLNIGANHLAYDPYSRTLLAGTGTGTSAPAQNSILFITPETGTVGSSAPLTGTPDRLALTSDGQVLYALVPGSTVGSIAHVNMLTRQLDFTLSSFQATGYNVGLHDIVIQPGNENTILVDEGEYNGMSVFDVDPIAKTATRRGSATGIYSSNCQLFPSSSTVFAGGGSLNPYSVTPVGLNQVFPELTLENFNCAKLDGGVAFAGAGGVASISGTTGQQLGSFSGLVNMSNYGVGILDFAPDTSLGRSFYLTDSSYYNSVFGYFDQLTAFDNHTFVPSTVLPMPVAAIEGNTYSTGVDMVRWGQDGLAFLTSSGRVYLLRGGIVVPQLLKTNSSAGLAAASPVSATHGAGNTSLTLTGSNFLPGVAVLWNGSYRTTTIGDATHVSVAIPASDLASSGPVSITAVNPGAPPSGVLAFNIN